MLNSFEFVRTVAIKNADIGQKIRELIEINIEIMIKKNKYIMVQVYLVLIRLFQANL